MIYELINGKRHTIHTYSAAGIFAGLSGWLETKKSRIKRGPRLLRSWVYRNHELLKQILSLSISLGLAREVR